jgi:hypothetical protein
VAIRTCPLCLKRIPASHVIAYSDNIECPGCKTRLEVSAGSRMLATAVGLLAASLLWGLKRSLGGMLGWVLPTVYAFLAYSVVASLFLMATADLRAKPAEPLAEPVLGDRGHAHSAHQ